MSMQRPFQTRWSVQTQTAIIALVMAALAAIAAQALG